MTAGLDRGVQLKILRHLAEAYPLHAKLSDGLFATEGEMFDVRRENYNAHYLEGHGLIEIKTKGTQRGSPLKAWILSRTTGA